MGIRSKLLILGIVKLSMSVIFIHLVIIIMFLHNIYYKIVKINLKMIFGLVVLYYIICINDKYPFNLIL